MIWFRFLWRAPYSRTVRRIGLISFFVLLYFLDLKSPGFLPVVVSASVLPMVAVTASILPEAP